jgi:tetraacyldisaccharide 4'-kinase
LSLIKLFHFFLYPFSWLYGGITDCRNWLYDIGFFKAKSFENPIIINVGNLTVGGTGKSPHVEYLLRLLAKKYRIATLSRGYGRKTKGFRIANDADNSATIGDEPLQFYQKFKEEVSVIVGENRVEAVQKIKIQLSDIEVVILDDSFQHRPILPDVNLLLVDYNRPIDKDLPFPEGRMRERRHGAKRADAVIISKCPDGLSEDAQNDLVDRLKPYLRTDISVFFTGIDYGKPIGLMNHVNFVKENFDSVILISGIAQAGLFVEYVTKFFGVLKHFDFPDHHDFSETDLFTIQTFGNASGKKPFYLMTEKDAVKIRPLIANQSADFYFLPIEIKFLNNESQFQDWLSQKLLSFKLISN